MEFLMLIDSLLNLIFFSRNNFHVFDFLFSDIKPFFKWTQLIMVLLGHLHCLFEEVHAIGAFLVQVLVSAFHLSNFTFNAAFLCGLSCSSNFFAHFDEGVNATLSVTQNFGNKLLFLNLCLDNFVIRRWWFLF